MMSMQLWYAPSSPFARKVRIAAHELGLTSQLELVAVNPWTDNRLRAINPLGKVPTLVVQAGHVIFESAIICDYLDSLVPPRRLFPQHDCPRWRALLLQGLADGASTAAGRLYAEEGRPETARSHTMMDRFRLAIDAVLDELETRKDLREHLTIGEISVAACLGYLDFRWPGRDWRATRPALAAWYDGFTSRPSMTSTEHRTP